MPVRYDKLVPALKHLLDEERIDLVGRSVAFIRRLRQLRASAFVWAVVLSRFGLVSLIVKTETCAGCALTSRCWGLRRGHAELYGTGELRAVAAPGAVG